MAADLHRQNIEKVVSKALSAANLEVNDLDAIAVTNRPGLQMCLFVGLRYAKHLARKFNKPLIPIHHMRAHALTVRMEQEVAFPFLCLLVSGGHCLLAIAQTPDKFLLLGESLDDAPGEAFDKIARRLKLRNIPALEKLSGGQAIEVAASEADSFNYDFPLPLARQRDCQFSFAGLKNSAKRHIVREERENGIAIDGVMPGYKNFSACFLKAITRHIAHRTQRAMDFSEEAGLLDLKEKRLVLSGGVACNNFLFKAISELGERKGYKVVRPSRNLCTDNGLMIAWNGVEKWKIQSDVVSDFDQITAIGRCPLGENWIQRVSDRNLQCKWEKLTVFR